MRISELNFRQLLDHYGIVIARDDGTKGTILCQFHEDHKPSCSIDFTKNLYYCFPCSEGGSIVNFVMGKENLDYAGAVGWLSEFFGDKVEVAGVDYHTRLMEEARSKTARLLDSRCYQIILSFCPELEQQFDSVFESVAKEQYKDLVKKRHEEADHQKSPDKWFWKDMSILIEDYLWVLECKWRDRFPWEKLSLMAQATEETYFDYWDEEIDRFATEKMLLKEVLRITERLLWRTQDMLMGDSKRLAEKAKRAMIDWLGLLKALSFDGQLLPKAYLISEIGGQYGGTN